MDLRVFLAISWKSNQLKKLEIAAQAKLMQMAIGSLFDKKAKRIFNKTISELQGRGSMLIRI